MQHQPDTIYLLKKPNPHTKKERMELRYYNQCSLFKVFQQLFWVTLDICRLTDKKAWYTILIGTWFSFYHIACCLVLINGKMSLFFLQRNKATKKGDVLCLSIHSMFLFFCLFTKMLGSHLFSLNYFWSSATGTVSSLLYSHYLGKTSSIFNINPSMQAATSIVYSIGGCMHVWG